MVWAIWSLERIHVDDGAPLVLLSAQRRGRVPPRAAARRGDMLADADGLTLRLDDVRVHRGRVAASGSSRPQWSAWVACEPRSERWGVEVYDLVQYAVAVDVQTRSEGLGL